LFGLFGRRSAKTFDETWQLYLKIEEAAVILITVEGTYFGAAEEAVTVSGYGVVGGVAQERRDESQE
jgi:hypothetical protein